MTSTGRVTIRDVAEPANVSAATVSRVTSGKYPVPAATRARVLHAARSLDYAAHAHARALVGGGRTTVAAILRQVTSPFCAQVAVGVEAGAAAHGRLSLVAATGGEPRREMESVRPMREEGAQVVILVGGVVEDRAQRERVARHAHALDAPGARLVLCGRPAPDPGIPALVVEFDSEAGARAITGHVLSAGHRRVAFLGGRPGNTTLDARVTGFRESLERYGLPPGDGRVVDCGLGRAAGQRTMADLIKEDAGFTAVVAGDDMVAAGRCAPSPTPGCASPPTSPSWAATTSRSPPTSTRP